MTKDVDDWEVLGVLLGIRDPETTFDKIKQSHKEPKAQKETMLTLWHTNHPLASWSLLHQALNMKGNTKEAQAVQKKFLKGDIVSNFCVRSLCLYRIWEVCILVIYVSVSLS